jgi:hypothetical protein
MKILKTMVPVTGGTELLDTIEFAGRFWLVLGWVEFVTEGVRKPKRLVCLETIPHQAVPNHPNCQFVVTSQLPRFLFDGRVPPGQEKFYVVEDAPDITVPILH